MHYTVGGYDEGNDVDRRLLKNKYIHSDISESILSLIASSFVYVTRRKHAVMGACMRGPFSSSEMCKHAHLILCSGYDVKE